MNNKIKIKKVIQIRVKSHNGIKKKKKRRV